MALSLQGFKCFLVVLRHFTMPFTATEAATQEAKHVETHHAHLRAGAIHRTYDMPSGTNDLPQNEPHFGTEVDIALIGRPHGIGR